MPASYTWVQAVNDIFKTVKDIFYTVIVLKIGWIKIAISIHLLSTQKQFAEAIRHFLRETIPEEWRKFRDQVTDNFRIISHQNFWVLQ